MRIPSGVTDQYIYFVAVDETDLKTRETGLSSFTVYRSRDGAAAAAMTTPTVNETDATNMPGVYELLLDEDMTIGSGNDSEEMVFHITVTGMAPVSRVIELYRSKITAGNTLDVTATGAAGIDWGNVENQTTSVDLSATDISLCDTITTYTGNTVQTGDNYTRLGAPSGASVSVDIADIPTVSEFNARTILSASYFDPTTDAVATVTDVTNEVTADVTKLNGVAQSLLDLKDFADDGYDPTTDKIQGVVLVDTTTTNTDMVGTDDAALATVCTEVRLGELDSGNLPTDIANIQSDTDDLQTQIGTAGAGLSDLGGMSTGMKAEVNVEVKDVLDTDTHAEPGQGTPAATISITDKINYLYKAWRNKATQTASTYSLYNDAGDTVDQKADVSDNGTTATMDEKITGP